MPPGPARHIRPAHHPSLEWSRVALNVLLPIAGVIVALAVGALMLALLKANPLTAYAALFNGVVGSRFGLTQMFVKATPLLMVGLGI